MKFKLDENLGHRWQALFSKAGHEADTVLDERMSGASDQSIYEVCRKERRCLVTLDLDFADVLRFPPWDTEGIAVLRPPKGQSQAMLESLLRNLLRAIATESVSGTVWIVEVNRIRIHQVHRD